MASRARLADHVRYKSRINDLFSAISLDDSPETQAHSAKYLAVLISGYLEQAIKELLLAYASDGSRGQISSYITKTWPVSRNMNVNNIEMILGQFDETWKDNFLGWISEDPNRKEDINSIVSWRNRIAHGQESGTTGVTVVAVKAAFSTVTELVGLIGEWSTT